MKSKATKTVGPTVTIPDEWMKEISQSDKRKKSIIDKKTEDQAYAFVLKYHQDFTQKKISQVLTKQTGKYFSRQRVGEILSSLKDKGLA